MSDLPFYTLATEPFLHSHGGLVLHTLVLHASVTLGLSVLVFLGFENSSGTLSSFEPDLVKTLILRRHPVGRHSFLIVH